MLEQIEKRIADLMQQLEQSAANHNMLVGMLTEARNVQNAMKVAAPVIDSIADAVPALEPVAELVDEVAAL